MVIQLILFILDAFVINLGFFISFLIRYGLVIPERSFLPYKKSFVFLTIINTSVLFLLKVYKNRFQSSWDLFRRVFLGLFFGTLLSVAFIYIFRIKWGAFPTSVFILSFFVNLLLIFKLNQYVLKAKKKIRKKVVIIGEGDIEEFPGKKADIERKRIDEIEDLIKYADTDEIIICEKIRKEKDLNLLIYLVQKLKINMVFSPSSYMELLAEKIHGENSVHFLSTFVGKKADVDEFLMRSLDIVGSLIILFVSMPIITVVSLLIKITSSGPILYKQQRAGKDGKIFALYKFRTMVTNAQEFSGLAPTKENDPRVTRLGKLLRRTHLDELPQLFNILRGDMSLVGPRPENLYRVNKHKALQGLRLAVKPGLTGLAQVRSFYDLHPKHKIKYDYLYIQRRSFWLNMYILLQTIPAVFSRKGR